MSAIMGKMWRWLAWAGLAWQCLSVVGRVSGEKPLLRMRKDFSFKVLQLTDLHYGESMFVLV